MLENQNWKMEDREGKEEPKTRAHKTRMRHPNPTSTGRSAYATTRDSDWEARRRGKHGSEDQPRHWLFEVAHQGGGGVGGFFDFVEGARVGVWVSSELVREKIGVGGNDAEEIVESVGDDLIFGEGDGDAGGIGGGSRDVGDFVA